MNAKRLIFLIAAVLIVYPMLYCIVSFAPWHHGQIAESSIYSLDLGRFFHDILLGRSVFNAGNYTVYPLNYFFVYSGVALLEHFFNGIPSYLLFVAAFDLAAFYYFIKLLLLVTNDTVEAVSLKRFVVICLLGLLYLTSLSNFNYIKSNVIFLLPYLVLLPLLYYATLFVRDGDRRHLIPFLLFSLMLGDFNLAHVAIIILALNVFLVVQRRLTHINSATFLRRVAVTNTTLLPALCFLLVIVADNIFYSANLRSFAIVAAENMYSNNAQYLNIFGQMTDWGLFGRWNQSLYYHFSPYYIPGPVTIFALVPFALLGFAAATSRATLATRRFANLLLIVVLVIFQIMLGNNNIIYSFLYHHVLAFQVFRNVTKLAPLLLLFLTFAIYAFLYDSLDRRRRFWTTLVLLGASFVYNVPYWTYSGYIYGNRAVERIPQYWHEAASYINKHTNGYDRVLALPAIYVNDIYFWHGRKTWVQGSLLDILIKDQSFRLSERSIGSPEYQADADSVFVKSATSIRHLDVNYSRLTWLAKTYGFDYVVLSNDLLSEYERTADIRAWLKSANYHEVAAYGPVSVYHNSSYYIPPFSGADLSIRRINNLRFELRVRASTKSRTLTFNAPFHSGWQLSAEPPTTSLCPSNSIRIGPHETACGGDLGGSFFGEIRHLFSGEASTTHFITRSGTNGWRFPAPLARGMTFGLYFRPQAIFYLVVLISIVSFFLVFGFLLLPIRIPNSRPLMLGRLVGEAGFVWVFLALLAVISPLASPLWHGRVNSNRHYAAEQLRNTEAEMGRQSVDNKAP